MAVIGAVVVRPDLITVQDERVASPNDPPVPVSGNASVENGPTVTHPFPVVSVSAGDELNVDGALCRGLAVGAPEHLEKRNLHGVLVHLETVLSIKIVFL